MGKANKKKKHDKNRSHGHYCYVCGEHKSNESFSGHGHASHICRKCHALPVAERNEMVAIRKIENMAFRWLSEAEIKWRRKRMKDYRPDVRSAAIDTYNIKFPHHNRDLDKLTELKTPVLFSELDDERKAETLVRLNELVSDFFAFADYLPDDDDRDEILSQLCEETTESLNRWEPEPYDPVAEYYDPRFDFGSDVSFDEKIRLTKEILNAEARGFRPICRAGRTGDETAKGTGFG